MLKELNMLKRMALCLLVLPVVHFVGCGDYGETMSESGMGWPTNWEDGDDDNWNAPSGDQYDAPGTNPFVITAHDPLSTFSADVDTASYDIFRRDIGYNTLPAPESVRLEEYVNAFSYDYEAPPAESSTPFSIALSAAPSLVADTTVLAIGIQAMEVPFERKPANLVFLIDVSGSMSDTDKLPLVQVLLTEALDALNPTDTISIVTYASSTSLRLAPTPVSERETIAAVINSLQAGGSTAGAGGIQLAYEQAEAGLIEDGINHVVLCTDGDFNVGISSTEALVDLIEEKRQSGITLTVLGFGRGNLNDAMMEGISNAGNGIYSVIANEDHAIDYAHNDLLATIIHVAKDVKFQVEFNPDEVYAYRLLGYENRILEDDEFRDDRVDAGEVGSGHTVTALYELVLVGGEIPVVDQAPDTVDGPPSDEELAEFDGELCRVRIRYKDVDATEDDSAYEVEEAIFPADVASSFDDADSDLQWASAIAAFAEILKESPYAQYDALDAIESVVNARAGTDADRLEFVSLFGVARTYLGR